MPTEVHADRKSFRQSMAWLHTWTGLVPGWVVFLIFLFGTAAFFQQEVDRWMRPELRAAPVSAQALDAADAVLAARAAGAETWGILLPGDRGDGLSLSWSSGTGRQSRAGEAMLDPASGREVAVRDTRGGGFLYAFHYNLHYLPYWLGRQIVMIASLAMLVAILSGIVTHKKLFADFFMLRFGKGQRSWLDAHNVTGVLALPFHLMITYTGLVTLLFTLMPWTISASFPSREAFFDAAFPHPHAEVSGRSAPVMPLRHLAAKARSADNSFIPEYILIEHPGDANAIAEIKPRYDTLPSSRSRLYLNAATGEVVQPPHDRGVAPNVASAMVDLHAGLFAGPMLRWLYFIAGVGGTIMIATGLVLWTVKRRARLPDPACPPLGFRFVERLNIGVIAGGTAGIAIYFLANRLLPPGMANRADWEINSLFIGWGALAVWSITRPARQAWIETLAAGALLYALVPIVNTLTTERGLMPSLMARDWVFAGFDLTMLATAAILAVSARKVAMKAAPGRKAGGRVEATA